MPFAYCQSCGRLFHFLEPFLPEAAGRHWQGDAVDSRCPECRQITREHQHNPEDDQGPANVP